MCSCPESKREFCANKPIAQGKDAKERCWIPKPWFVEGLCMHDLHWHRDQKVCEKELNLFKAEHKAGTSGDIRILTQQLRGPAKGQGNSKRFADWAVPTTHPAGWSKRHLNNEGHWQQGQVISTSLHTQLMGLCSKTTWATAALFWGLNHLYPEKLGGFIDYALKGLERKTSVFFVFEVYTLSFPYHYKSHQSREWIPPSKH